MNLDLSEYMGAYTDGCAENLDTMDKMLLNLEQNPNNLDAMEEIFRAAHTLKGMSATMGFEKIAHLTHEMETILDKMRNHQIPITTRVIDVIFETFDVLRTLVNDSIEQTDSNIDLTEISTKLAALYEETLDTPPDQPPAVQTDNTPVTQNSDGLTISLAEMDLSDFEISKLSDASDEGKFIYFLKVTLVSDCLLKGPRVFMILRTLDDFQCNIIKSKPEVKDLENEKFDLDFEMVLTSDRVIDIIHESIEAISEIETVNLTDITDFDFYGEGLSEPPPSSAPAAPQPAEPAVAPAQTAPPTPPTSAPQPAAPTVQPVYEPPPTAVPSAPPLQQLSPQPTDSEIETDEDDENEIVEMVQLVTFKMAGEIYALEIRQVEAIINLVPITRVPKAPVYIDGVINLRGEIVPVINTRYRLRLGGVEKKASNQIIILSFENEKIKAGFLVDQVLEVIRLPETSIEAPSRVSDSVNIEYLKGVGKIDNKIIILLNAYRIVFSKNLEPRA